MSGLRVLVAHSVVAITVALLVGGCSPGGSSTGNASGELWTTNFVIVIDPQGQVVLPTVFADQALEFTFDGALDDGILGGFIFDAAGAPVEFEGLGASPSTVVPYYAYVDQTAARSSIEIRENTTFGPMPAGYVVGRHRDKPDTLVVDTRIPFGSPTGLTPVFGLQFATEYTYRIPANNGLTVGNGVPVRPVGVEPMTLPIVVDPLQPIPSPSPVFVTLPAYGPDPVPPQVVSIEAVGPAGVVAGTANDPLPSASSSINVTFSKPVDPTSLDLTENLQVRNLDLATAFEPGGPLVPGFLVIDPAAPHLVVFVPTPSFGPGVSPAQGYAISVAVGGFGNPNLAAILGAPQGAPATQLELANSLTTTFVTEPCPTCEGALSVVESFTSTAQHDTTYAPVFGAAAEWGGAGSSALAGVDISGAAVANFNGNPTNLGTRTQVTMPIGPGTNLPLTTVPFPGLPEPFTPQPGGGPGVSPNGGSHAMWLIESVDLGNPNGSLELIEWGPVNDTTVATSYPQYQCWAGSTTITAPITCPLGVTGLSTFYAQNYDQVPLQPADPANLHPDQFQNPGAGAVLTTPPQTYVVGATTTSYYPFPVFDPPFDYVGSSNNNLLYEINIEGGLQLPNFNRYRAANFVPVRRIIGPPLSSGQITSAGSGCDMYDTRFTFVDVVSVAQSAFYDTAVTGATPTFVGLTLSPGAESQPVGTSSLWELEGASAILGPTLPVGPSTGFLTYWSGTPQAGAYDPLVLQNAADPMAPQLTGNRYFRFRATLRNNAIDNTRPSYGSLVAAVAVVP